MDSERPVEEDDIDTWLEEDDEVEEVSSTASKNPEQKYAESQLRVVRETKDYQLDYLKMALEPGRELINISPAYQRRLRWSNKKKSLLIESLLLNIPVPPVFLFENDYNAFEVIDGRQRLDAISSYLSNGYALTGLQYWPEFNRKYFRSLPTVIQKGLLRRSIPAVVLLAETRRSSTDDVDVRSLLFDRLNTGGVRLNPQELRNALHPGGFNDLLIELARYDNFTRPWGIPSRTQSENSDPPEELLKNRLYSTMSDAELVLRFFALRDAVLESRTGSLRTILDRYMEISAGSTTTKLEEFRELFKATIDSLIDRFGEAVFRLPGKGRLSRPLYDALMVAESIGIRDGATRNPRAVEDLQKALRESETYDVLVGRGNTIGAVHDRVGVATGILWA